MTAEKALEIKKFCTAWITKVVSKNKAYQQRLIAAIDDLFPNDIAEYDGYSMLDCKDWDDGEEYFDEWSGRKKWHCGMGDRMRELIEWDNIFSLTKKGQTDLTCTIRIAIDLLIEQSGGVVGYTVGDLRKVFDGNIPDFILNTFENKEALLAAGDEEGIWL